ncbi:hypothetical protein QJS04_geneDACA009107 [Acorus gramineus]|uniref:Plastid transcriptionally active 6 n=1 Tax=Acorus gramineus TaxID=55184 RepID=A0AAV9ARS2_ACOGR|nr:hypothetical protein QJS04_geneDACA009107 [Acorus gramineus]
MSSLFLFPNPLPPPLAATHTSLRRPPFFLFSPTNHATYLGRRSRRWRGRRDFIARVDDGDVDSGGGGDDYDMEEEEVEEVDNKKDYDVEYEYDRLLSLSSSPRKASGSSSSSSAAEAEVVEEGVIEIAQSESFVSTEGWESETVVDYKINEEEFHKISLLHCDFFIRRPPDPDNNVYDFREMYVTPPDMDIYAIPKVLAPMPQKVFLTKHYRNRRADDVEFVLDFEEIYVIDSKTKSITRAKVLVTAPGGKDRDRRSDLLIIRDNGTSFKIIDMSERDDPSTVIEREEWIQTRKDMENHLRKLRDFSTSNWF